jgi:hypothetical protein
MTMTFKACLSGLCAAAVMLSLAVTAADARKRNDDDSDGRSRSDRGRSYNDNAADWARRQDRLNPPGTPHTCGHFGFQYDSRGVPMGPYCN